MTITAADDGEGSLVDSQNITVGVSDDNENTAPELGEDASVTIAENTTAVSSYAGRDAEYENITCALTGDDAGLFEIDVSGSLSFIAAPDFEAGETGPYAVTITATDDGEGNLVDSQNITVGVGNVI